MVLSPIAEPIHIFFSLAPTRRDRKLFEQLRRHLSLMRRQGLVQLWHDSEIAAGSDADASIRTFLNTADIIVLLLSADFFASDQCVDVEMAYALEQSAIRAVQVIPVLLRPTDLSSLTWKGFSFEQQHPLPPNKKPVSAWRDLDKALSEVARGIRNVVEDLARRWAGAPRPAKSLRLPLSTLPHRRNPFFTNRGPTLKALHRAFTSEQTSSTSIQALRGIGGIGKTLVAIEYVYLHQEDYQATLWLHASSYEVVHADLRTLVDRLNIPLRHDAQGSERMEAVKAWLQHHDRWLLVLDNLDDFSLLNQLIPLESSGHVLLTTQSEATGPFANAISVDALTPDEGALLLLRRAKIIAEKDERNAVSETTYLQALTLARALACYPLALDQAGAYIEETQRSLDAYLALYQQRQTALLGTRGRLAHDHPDPVTTTLSLTFDKVAQVDAHALDLLRLFAFLHPEGLPDEILPYGAASLAEPLRPFVRDPFALDAALATLRRFSLVHHRAERTTLHMHSIVQVVLRSQLTPQQHVQFAKQAVRLINAIFPEVAFATWNECERYASQAQHCATLMQDYRLTLPEGALLLERLGFYYYQRGCYAEAEPLLRQALQVQERQGRTDPLDTAQTLNSLGLLLQRLEHVQEAELLHRRALQLREQALGPEHPKTAESLHNLAVLYEKAGQYQQAEQFYQRVLAADERAVGANHPDIARTLNNLALIVYLQGRYQQAETLYQRALDIYERASYTNHPDITYTLNGLGTLYEVQGNYQQAHALYQRALLIREQALGNKHSETAHSSNTLAHLFELQGDYQQAEALYQQALSRSEEALGTQHRDIALFLNNLGVLASRQDQYQQAEQRFQQALRIYEQTLGGSHPATARVLANLGQLAHKMGEHERAEALLRQALAIREQALGTMHPDTAHSLSILADLLIDKPTPEDALPLLQQALAIRLQTLAPGHPEIARLRETYARLLEQLHRGDEASIMRQPIEQPPGQEGLSDNTH